MSESAFWIGPVATIFAGLGPSQTGLTSVGAGRRLLVDGPNDAAVTGRPSAGAWFLRRFSNPLVISLLLASVLSAVTGDVASLIIVSAIVFLSVLMDVIQELRAQNHHRR